MEATTSKPVPIGLAAAILVILLFPFLCPNVGGQDATTFTRSDKFSIPELNGTISFALNGSCSSATLVNASWLFTNLRLNNSQPVGNLTVSAVNSTMTILSYSSFVLLGRSAQLRYNAQGVGTQTVNLGLNSSRPTHPGEWSINVAGKGFISEGNGWNLLPNDTVVVSGLTGNISVTHFGYVIPDNSNLPFYQQHSAIIITAIVLSVVVAVAVVIRVKVRS